MTTLDIHNPATGALLAALQADDAASIAVKARAARAAQPAWAALPLAERVAIVQRFRNAVVAEREALASTLTQEVGKPIAQSRNELNGLLPRLDFFLSHAERALADETVFDEGGMRERISHVPLGLVANISAWNYPWFVSCNVVVPALLAGALLADYVQAVLYESVRVIAGAFIVGGLAMLVAERWRPRPTVMEAEHTPILTAFGVGGCQMLALVPGVSRSGATIVGGMLLGLDRPAAAEFSFFLAMPTMAAAFGYELMQVRTSLPADRSAEIVIGFVMAFLASVVVVKPFLSFVRRSGFAPFAWYRIALAAVTAVWLMSGRG